MTLALAIAPRTCNRFVATGVIDRLNAANPLKEEEQSFGANRLSFQTTILYCNSDGTFLLGFDS
jgi:hypothetical protein